MAVITTDLHTAADLFAGRDSEFLSMRDACKRVKRSRRTLRRWMAQGMPFVQFRGRKYILLEDLLSTYRGKLESNPAHQQRMRRLAREDSGLTN